MSGAVASFHGLNLVVRDMEATLAFYRRLGVAIPAEAIWATETGGHHVTAGKDDPVDFEFDSLALARAYDTGRGADTGAGIVIGFSLPTREAVDEKYREMIGAGYEGSQPPYDAFWGSRYAILLDPDRNRVGFMSPPDPDRRSAPPSV